MLAKERLTPNAMKANRLFTDPFAGPVERDEQFFDGGEVPFYREMLRQVALNASFLALVGESGAGKTTLVADLEAWLQREQRRVIVIAPSTLGMSTTGQRGSLVRSSDILAAVITGLKTDAAVPASMQARSTVAARMLVESAEAGNQHLLVLEEAHAMPDETLRHLKRLHEMRYQRRSLLGVLLVGQPELKRRLVEGLRQGSLREVAQRCELLELLPLGDALHGYLECRARACGRPLSALMTLDAIEPMRARLSKKTAAGIVGLDFPLAANNLITRALNVAAELGAPVVDADVMKGC